MESEDLPGWERRIAGWVARRLWMGDRRGGPWPVPDHLTHEEVRFEGNTGAQLVGRYFPLEGKARGVVVCAHPDRRYAGHWFVKTGWVDFLLEAGFEVLTFDFTGYGGSDGPATYYAEDVREAVRFARRWSGGLEVHVIGVSLGAYAAAIASPWLSDVRGLVLESPYPDFVSWYRRGLPRLGAKTFSRLFPATGRFLQADERIARAAPERILVAAGGADTITPPQLSRVMAQRAPQERTRYLESPGAAHLELIETPGYRQTVLETLGVEEVDGTDPAVSSANGLLQRAHT